MGKTTAKTIRPIEDKIMEAMGLEQVILIAKRFYYTGRAEVLMDDYRYDMLEERLKKLCPNHPMNDVVGYADGSYKLLNPAQTRALFEEIT
jgi:hypothetical protein